MDLSTHGRPGPEPPAAVSGGQEPANEAGDRRKPDYGLPLPAFTVVTVFECETWSGLAGVLIRFTGMRRAIRRATPGLITSATVVQWRERRIINISAWDSLASMRKMGDARKHITAAHFAGRTQEVHTGSAIYRNAGHWKQVLWGIPARQ